MHIADAILSPQVCAGTAVLSAAAVAYSLRTLQNQQTARTVPLTGMLAAMVFAGQMVNFPLFGLPVSGHLLGGVLASVVVGPHAGLIAIATVLAIQMLLFGDGGWLAYGANVLNMGVVGGFVGYAVYRFVRGRWPGERGIVLGAVLGAWLSVMAASFAFCLEFALSHPAGAFDLTRIVTLMTSLHALIGIGEALITGLVLAYVVGVARRVDLIYQPGEEGAAARVGRVFWLGVGAALVVAAFAAPFASGYADGLEAVGERTGFGELAAEPRTIWLTDYAVPWLEESGLAKGGHLADKLAVSLAGLVGTLAIVVVAVVCDRLLCRRPAGLTGSPADPLAGA
jgi:cobalt/nickel transport system permease protein